MSKLIPPKNVLLLGGVLLLGIAARYHGEHTYSSAANFDLKAPQNIADARNWTVICLAAVVGSFFGAVLGYRLNRVTAAIAGMVGGAVATAHYSSILGGLLGVPMSLLVAVLGPRRMAIAALACLVAALAGVCGGYVAGAISLGPVEPTTLLAAMLLVAGIVVAGNVCLARWCSGAAVVKTWRRIAGRLTLATMTLSAAVGAIPLGITLDSILWVRKVGAGEYNMELRPLGADCLTRGFCSVFDWGRASILHKRDLRKLRRFDRLAYLYLSGADIDDDSLDVFGEFPRLSSLDLSGKAVTDKGVKQLANLRLWSLNLSGTRITGECFSQLPLGLQQLRLGGTALSDASLARLTTLPLSWPLDLKDTPIGDAGIANLRGLRALHGLDLSGTLITDAALATLAKDHPKLTNLELANTRITDAGIANLTKLPMLRYLDVSGCAITDEAVDDLMRCKLISLRLSGTKLTSKGIGRLREAMPNCNVECEF